VFREFGVGQYLVQIAEVRREHLRAAFTVALGTAWSIGLLLLALSGPMAHLYGNDGIREVLLLSAANFAIMPFGTPLLALLNRELRFATLAWIAVIGAAAQALATVGAAWLGQSYLSMAWGTLAMTITNDRWNCDA
jgi:O-antigen/teichoic acid export membrane protein